MVRNVWRGKHAAEVVALVTEYHMYNYRRLRPGGERMITAFTSVRIPSTAIPRIRNGRSTIHTIEYITSAKSASGQQITKRIHHKMNESTESVLLSV